MSESLGIDTRSGILESLICGFYPPIGIMGLKVFDLECGNRHLFEGWFSSHEDYDSQQARGLISCPLCQNDKIEKRLSAPRINVGHFEQPRLETNASTDAAAAAEETSRSVMATNPEAAQLMQMQAAVLQQMREFVRKTENVGDRFADEARRIHEGESDERPIRGTATREEREALAEEGIAVVGLPDFLDIDRLQ